MGGAVSGGPHAGEGVGEGVLVSESGLKTLVVGGERVRWSVGSRGAEGLYVQGSTRLLPPTAHRSEHDAHNQKRCGDTRHCRRRLEREKKNR